MSSDLTKKPSIEVASPTAQSARNEAAIKLLQEWAERGDETEQRETLDYLKRAIDSNRLGQRKHFP